MKTMVKKIMAFMLSAMMLTAIPVINASAEEVDHTDWCVEENGVLTWTFNHTLSSSHTLGDGEVYNCGKGLTLVKGVKIETNGSAKLGKADASSSYIKFAPEQNGVLTVEATSASTTLFVDTNIRDDLQKAYSESEPSQLTLEAGVNYYIYNTSSNTAVTITKITFTPDTTGATVWDLTNVNNRLENYATFTADDTYEYQGLTLTGGSSSSINKNGVKLYKNSGFVIYEPICNGTLSVKLTNSSNKTIYIDTNDNRSKQNSFTNSTEGTKTVEKGQTYYIYNGDSADVYVKQLIFTPDTFTVTFNSNGGSEVPSQQITGGQTAAQPEAPTKAGHTFEGWKLNNEDYDFSTPVTEDITLVAQWTEGTAGKVGYAGAFTAKGVGEPTESKEGSNYATAYTAEFNVTDADKEVYINPEIEWSFDFGNDAPEVGNTKKTKSVSTGSLENDFKYGLVINGVYLLEKDAAVSATLRNGVSEQSGQ